MPIFKLSKTPIETPEPKEITNQDDIQLNDESVVVLDGPLSKIYTEALNKVYAIESYMTDGALTDDKEKDEDLSKTYIYAVDADDLDIAGTNETFGNLRLALDSQKYDKIILSIEHVEVVSESIAIIDEYAKKTGVNVVYKREQAIGAI